MTSWGRNHGLKQHVWSGYVSHVTTSCCCVASSSVIKIPLNLKKAWLCTIFELYVAAWWYYVNIRMCPKCQWKEKLECQVTRLKRCRLFHDCPTVMNYWVTDVDCEKHHRWDSKPWGILDKSCSLRRWAGRLKFSRKWTRSELYWKCWLGTAFVVKGLVEKGGLHWRADEANRNGTEEELRLGNTNTTGLGEGVRGEVGWLTGAGNGICGAKLKSRKAWPHCEWSKTGTGSVW